jgi:phosphoadenosine phosphosulfate reductase
MIKYHCKKCTMDIENPHIERVYIDSEDIEDFYTEIKKCPVCDDEINVTSKIYWCKHCNIPIYDEVCSLCGNVGEYITTDLRPVFPEERLLLEILIGEPFKYINSSVWNGVGNRYIVDGKKLKVTISSLISNKDVKEIISELDKYKDRNNYNYFNENISHFIDANRNRFNFIVSEATEFTKNVSKGYNLDEMFISFSGGKDSTVVQDLVTKALSNPKIIHIFGDTTLEFPFTMEYVERFKKENRLTPMLSARNKEKNFDDMCDLVGPPSRVMRWCCTVFKTGAINKKTNGVFKDKKRLLTFYGVRRSESVSRSKYKRESKSPKITKQMIVSPIIDWFDFDIWLYILTNGIDFNDAYRLGFARVGCWCCPNNSDWSQFLTSIFMNDKYEKWRSFLISFARRIGKPDAEVYVDSGNWKARQGGNGVGFSQKSFVSFEPCALEEHSFNYDLKKPISEQLYEFFKPFGWISKELGNERLGEVFVVDRNNNPIIRLQGKIGTSILKVSILKLPLARARSIREARMKIECQLTKYQMCVNCLGCESVCKHNAIIIKKDLTNLMDETAATIDDRLTSNIYTIDDNKCVRCGECINHFDGGCYMRKVLTVRRGE